VPADEESSGQHPWVMKEGEDWRLEVGKCKKLKT